MITKYWDNYYTG
jgi:TPR repeat protein